jgi:ribose 5-phosphate isomerase B
MRVAIASDHAGFAQKQQLAQFLLEQGYQLVDLGPNDDSRVDYPDYALLVAGAVSSGDVDKGVLVCGTGIGMAIAANKVAGIRAANVTSAEFAALAREHNDANIVSVSGRFVSFEENSRIVLVFLQTAFGEGRHAQRVEKISELECDRLATSKAK